MARKLFVCCAVMALYSISFAQNATDQQVRTARETSSGMATGKRQATSGDPHEAQAAEVKSPRDAATGQASGKRQHKPTMSGAQSNPLYKDDGKSGMNPLYQGSQREGVTTARETGSGMATGKRNGVATGAGAAAGADAAVIKTKTKSNQSNDRLVNAGPKNGASDEAGEATVIKTKTKSNQSNDRTVSGGVNVAAGDVDSDGAADKKADPYANITWQKTGTGSSKSSNNNEGQRSNMRKQAKESGSAESK